MQDSGSRANSQGWGNAFSWTTPAKHGASKARIFFAADLQLLASGGNASGAAKPRAVCRRTFQH